MQVKSAVLVTLGLSVAGVAVAAAPPIAAFSFGTAFGRLPKNVVPIDYSISITPNAQARTLTGTEKIALQFRSATDTIVFNSLNETLRDVLLDGKPVKTVVSNDEQQLTTLTLNSSAPMGRHTLSF